MKQKGCRFLLFTVFDHSGYEIPLNPTVLKKGKKIAYYEIGLNPMRSYRDKDKMIAFTENDLIKGQVCRKLGALKGVECCLSQKDRMCPQFIEYDHDIKDTVFNAIGKEVAYGKKESKPTRKNK